jgi:hypothetical protein
VCCSCEAAHLCTVCVEGGVLVVRVDGFCVEFEGSGPVLVAEGIVALVLERNGFFTRVRHGACGLASAGVTAVM